MRIYDQHLHSYHSFDSRAVPQACVEAAIASGLSGLTFTEHFDTHPDDWSECLYDDARYSDTIDALRTQYGRRIFVGKGIEVCYQPDRIDFILDFLDRHTFDIVLLSVHYFDHGAIHRRENWTGLDAAQGTRLYLEHVLEAVRACETLHRARGRVFDVLGHLDLAKRYTRRFFESYDVSGCATLIDDILRTLLAADMVPEINTSTLRQGLDETMPGERTIRRYAELGGTMMTIGSDAHRPEDIAAGFDHAQAMLRRSGVDHIAVFRDRRRTELALAGE